MSPANIVEPDASATVEMKNKKVKTQDNALTAAKGNGSKKLKKKIKDATNDFEFTGRVESINVKGAGVNSNQFLFSLVNKKGEHHSYLLDSSEQLRFSAMASLLTSAFATGVRVKIRTAPNANGPGYGGELEVRMKG